DCSFNNPGNCPCLQLAGTFCQAPTDGGDIGACVPALPDGSPCVDGTCGSGGGLCACAASSICIDDDGGGGHCTAPATGGNGTFCYPASASTSATRSAAAIS